MANLERQLASGPSTAPPAPSTATAPANRMMNFVTAGVQAQAERSSRQQQAAAANDEDIELPDESNEEDDDQIAEKSVPAAVFGELGKRAAENRERRKALVPRRMSSLAPLRGSSEGVNGLPLSRCPQSWCPCNNL
uniref:Uncharacterized protein n=1 Tax=Oryza meridionalis TaxID=40149 RepID=A0A0E0F290_9ORYZ